MFEGMGVDNASIAFPDSLILLPWTLKPLWGPFLELFKTKKFYVVTTQILTGTAFGLTALSLTMPNFFAPAILFLAVAALSGATHDIACDGVYVRRNSPRPNRRNTSDGGGFLQHRQNRGHGRPRLSGRMADRPQLASRRRKLRGQPLGMDRHNGHARRHNDRPRNIPHLHPPFVGEKGNAAPAQKRRASDVLRELWSVLREFFTKRHIRVYILFIILYRFGEGFVVKIVPLFLKGRP